MVSTLLGAFFEMKVLQSLILIFTGLASIAVASDSNNYFTNPASNTGINPVWTLGDKQVIAWKTTLGVFNVSIWQQSLVQQSAASQGNIYSKIHSSDKVTNFTWVVQLYGFDLSYSNVFFLWINPDEDGGFVSSYFNITEPSSTTTTASTATSTATDVLSTAITSPSSSSLSSSSGSSLSSSSSSSPTAAADSALTTTGKIAMGVGVGLGVPILCALAVLIFLKSRSLKKNAAAQNAAQSGMAQPRVYAQNRQSRLQEMNGLSKQKSPFELPSQDYI
ncbi:uncharacterized protein N7496_008700 [Penicillium cataractarum]|uniref:Mid2 domain-containing protein n=1 Tax=Penicillium cataractarum TaxID=2100454 RepID=A0A9W9S053_9EURO|nr:uncharacterized protein N7496_008700 [Penicillium cataractarum]KAJ5368940.1 hypothetical protein N7496_008700 [Penicillium cataractarum]